MHGIVKNLFLSLQLADTEENIVSDIKIQVISDFKLFISSFFFVFLFPNFVTKIQFFFYPVDKLSLVSKIVNNWHFKYIAIFPVHYYTVTSALIDVMYGTFKKRK